MLIKIAVVEDDDASAKLILDYIDRFKVDYDDDFEVVRFSDGDEIASDYKPAFHIIFLDVQMKRLDGMSTAEVIRSFDKDVILIFITNMAQYAIKGYKVDALDFLLKPVPYFAFSEQLKRSVALIKSRQTSYLLIQTGKGLIRLNVSQITYVESFGHKILVHTDKEDYNIQSTMLELEKSLSENNFFRCNKGYLINLAYVSGVDGNVVKVGKNDLIISRARRKPLLDALIEYAGGLKA